MEVSFFSVNVSVILGLFELPFSEYQLIATRFASWISIGVPDNREADSMNVIKVMIILFFMLSPKNCKELWARYSFSRILPYLSIDIDYLINIIFLVNILL